MKAHGGPTRRSPTWRALVDETVNSVASVGLVVQIRWGRFAAALATARALLLPLPQQPLSALRRYNAFSRSLSLSLSLSLSPFVRSRGGLRSRVNSARTWWGKAERALFVCISTAPAPSHSPPVPISASGGAHAARIAPKQEALADSTRYVHTKTHHGSCSGGDMRHSWPSKNGVRL